MLGPEFLRNIRIVEFQEVVSQVATLLSLTFQSRKTGKTASQEKEILMFDALPNDATGLMNWSWNDIEPYYADLTKRSLSEDGVPRFLSDWTRIGDLIEEIFSRMHVATTINTADKEAEQRFHQFLDRAYPKLEEAEHTLKEKLLAVKVALPGL